VSHTHVIADALTLEWESYADKFQTFLTRASSYSSLASCGSRRRAVLIEDFPALTHQSTREAFHVAIKTFQESHSALGTPLIVIVSDEGFRGNTESSFSFRSKVDIRTVLPPSIFSEIYTTEIK
jgi:hypothetical protein